MNNNSTKLDEDEIRERMRNAEDVGVSGLGSFKNAPTAPQFLAQPDDADGALIGGGLLARAGIALLASPRGLGKSILALKLAVDLANGGEFCGEQLPPSRVLFCAYENSPTMLRERLRKLGGAEAVNLRILTRSKAPKLRSEEWQSFPVEHYDFIIIDSLSPALEGGIDERQGGQNSDALAALLDIVQRGPGALLIANTTKTASSIRGSGILSDRADLIFEVRDATDFKPNPKHEVWWEGLVDNQGEAAWAGRAKRRRGKTVFRLALIASKTRVGPELEPRVLELALPADGSWSVRDVSGDVAAAHEHSKTEAAEKRQALVDIAIAALKAALPLAKAEAEQLLTQNKLSKRTARQIIDGGIGSDWILAGSGTKADPCILRGIGGENSKVIKYNGELEIEVPILATPAAQGRQESLFKNATFPRASVTANYDRAFSTTDPPEPVSEAARAPTGGGASVIVEKQGGSHIPRLGGENSPCAKPNGENEFSGPILATTGTEPRRESLSENPSAAGGSDSANPRRISTNIKPPASVAETASISDRGASGPRTAIRRCPCGHTADEHVPGLSECLKCSCSGMYKRMHARDADDDGKVI